MKINGRHITGGVITFAFLLLFSLVASVSVLVIELGYGSYPVFEQPEPPKKKGARQ